jgi:hypothetical protein
MEQKPKEELRCRQECSAEGANGTNAQCNSYTRRLHVVSMWTVTGVAWLAPHARNL